MVSHAEPPDSELQVFVDATMQGARIDRLLADTFPHITRSRFQKLLRDGAVTARGKKVRSAYRVLLGDDVRVRLPRRQPLTLEPANIPLSIAYEDEDLLIVDKPAGMVVHPAAGNRRDTLVQALLHHRPTLAGGDPLRPGIVHRLDKDTSGLMVVAKNEAMHAALSAAMQARRIERRYTVLVWGRVRNTNGSIEAAIGRHPVARKRMAVRRAGGKPALTHWRMRERFAYTTLLEARLQTGRTHQIRVHMSWWRHPVFGDAVYGGRNSCLTRLSAGLRVHAREALKHLSRQALHASRLSFQHPGTAEILEFDSPVPDDLEDILARMRTTRESTPGTDA